MATKVSIDDTGLLQNEQRIPFRAGAVHYWRLEPSLWGRCLDRVRDLGLNLVETYVPWAVHEIARGGYDFGEIDRTKALPRFLEACAARSLRVILRPGPHINAELTYFGIPQRVLENPACLARTSRDTVAICPAPPRLFPIPSYAQKAFLDEVRGWFGAFARVIKPFLGSLVVAVQVDNEMSYFFRAGAFDLDYSEGSIALFREFVKGRYPKESAFSAAYGGAKFATVEPPRRFEATTAEELPQYLDWAAFKRFYLVKAVEVMRRMLVESGVSGVSFFHNLPPTESGSPLSIAAMEQVVDFAGLDLYHRRQEFEVVRRRVLTLAGTSRLPIVPELGAGGWLAWQSFTPEDNLQTTLASLMYGAKGFNWYMIVGRERWYGSPISREGQIKEPLYSWLRHLTKALKEVSFETLTREAKVGVMLPTEYADLAAVTSAAEPMTPFLFEVFGLTQKDLSKRDSFGLRAVVQQDGAAICDSWRAALDNARLSYCLVEGGAPIERLKHLDAVFVPTLDFLDDAFAAKLLRYAEEGGTVLMGPQVPDLDAKLLPGAPLGEVGVSLATHKGPLLAGDTTCAVPVGKGAVWFVEEFAFEEPPSLSLIVEALAEKLSLRSEISVTNAACSVWRTKEGEAKVLFLASAGEKEQHAEITILGYHTLTDPLSEEVFAIQEGKAKITVPPWTVRMLLVK